MSQNAVFVGRLAYASRAQLDALRADGFEVRNMETEQELFDYLNTKGVEADVVIIDSDSLGRQTSTLLLRRLKYLYAALGKTEPVMVLETGEPTREFLLEAVRSGVADIIVKPVAQASFAERIRQNMVRLGRAPQKGDTTRRTKTAVFTMSALSPEERLKQVTEKVQAVSALPAAVARIFQIFSQENIDLRELEQAVRSDLATSTMILRAANSASQAPGMRVMDVKTALLRIGLREARNAVAALSVFKMYSLRGKAAAFNRIWFWVHSLGTAIIAEELGVLAGKTETGELYLLGLLHDLGKIIMDDNLGADYAAALHLAAVKNLTLHEAEKRTFNKTHAEVGAEVCEKWKMPPKTVSFLSGHHQYERIADSEDENEVLIMLANYLSKAFLFGNGGDLLSPLLPDKIWDRLKVRGATEPDFAERMRSKLFETVEMMGIKKEAYDLGGSSRPAGGKAYLVAADGLMPVRAFLSARGTRIVELPDWDAVAELEERPLLIVGGLSGELAGFRSDVNTWGRLPFSPRPPLFLFGDEKPPERAPQGCFCFLWPLDFRRLDECCDAACVEELESEEEESEGGNAE